MGSIGEPPFGLPVYVLDDSEIRTWLERHHESQLRNQAIDNSQLFSQMDSLPHSSSSGFPPSLAPAIELQSPPESRKRKRREIDATNSHPGWRGLFKITDEMCRIPREQQQTLDKMDQWRPLVPPGFTPRMFVDGPINSSVTNTPVREARIRARSSATPSANSTPSAQRYIQNTPSNKPSQPVFISPSQPNLSVSKDTAATSTGSVVLASQSLHDSGESQRQELSTQAPQQSSNESQIPFSQGPEQSSNESQIPFTQAPLQYQQLNNATQMPFSQAPQQVNDESQMPFTQTQADISLNSPVRSVPVAHDIPPRIASTASSPLPPTSDTSYYDPLTHAFEMGYSSLNMHTQYDGGFAPETQAEESAEGVDENEPAFEHGVQNVEKDDTNEASPEYTQGNYPRPQESLALDFGTQYISNERNAVESEEELPDAEEVQGDYFIENDEESQEVVEVQDDGSNELQAETSEDLSMLPVGAEVQGNEVEEISLYDSNAGDEVEEEEDNPNNMQMQTTEYISMLPVTEDPGMSSQSLGDATPRSGFVAQTQTPIPRLQPFYDFSSQMTSFPETQRAEAELNFADDVAQMIETSTSAPEVSMSNLLDDSEDDIVSRDMAPDVSMSNIIDDSEQHIASKDIGIAAEEVESASVEEAPRANVPRSILEILVPKLAAEDRHQVIDMPMQSFDGASSGNVYEESQLNSEMSSLTELTQTTSDLQPSQASQMMSTQGTIVVEPESEPESELESDSGSAAKVLELSSDDDESLSEEDEDAENSDHPIIDHLEDSQMSTDAIEVDRAYTNPSIIPYTAARRGSASLTHPSRITVNELPSSKPNDSTDIVISSLPEEHDFVSLLSSSLPESQPKQSSQLETETAAEVETLEPDASRDTQTAATEDGPRLLESVTLQPSIARPSRDDSEEAVTGRSPEVLIIATPVVANGSASKSPATPSTQAARRLPATPKTPENATPTPSRTPSGRPLMEGRTPRSPLVELPIPLKESSVPGVNGQKRRSLPATFFTTYKSPKTQKPRSSMTPQKSPKTVFVMAALEGPPSNATQINKPSDSPNHAMPINEPPKGLLLPNMDVSYQACIANLLRVAEKGAFGKSWKAVWQREVRLSPKESLKAPSREPSKETSPLLLQLGSLSKPLTMLNDPDVSEQTLDLNPRKRSARALSASANDVSEVVEQQQKVDSMAKMTHEVGPTPADNMLDGTELPFTFEEDSIDEQAAQTMSGVLMDTGIEQVTATKTSEHKADSIREQVGKRMVEMLVDTGVEDGNQVLKRPTQKTSEFQDLIAEHISQPTTDVAIDEMTDKVDKVPQEAALRNASQVFQAGETEGLQNDSVAKKRPAPKDFIKPSRKSVVRRSRPRKEIRAAEKRERAEDSEEQLSQSAEQSVYPNVTPRRIPQRTRVATQFDNDMESEQIQTQNVTPKSIRQGTREQEDQSDDVEPEQRESRNVTPKVIRLIEKTRSPADRRRSLRKVGPVNLAERHSEPSVERRSEPPVESQFEPSVKGQSEPSVESQTEPSVGSHLEPSVKRQSEQGVKRKLEPTPTTSLSPPPSPTPNPKAMSTTATRKRRRSNRLESTLTEGDALEVGPDRRVTRSASKGVGPATSRYGDEDEDFEEGHREELRPAKVAKRDASSLSVASGDQAASGQRTVRHLMVHGRKGGKRTIRRRTTIVVRPEE